MSSSTSAEDTIMNLCYKRCIFSIKKHVGVAECSTVFWLLVSALVGVATARVYHVHGGSTERCRHHVVLKVSGEAKVR